MDDTEGQYLGPFATSHLWRKSAFSLPQTLKDSLFSHTDADIITFVDETDQAKHPLLANLNNDFTRLDLDLRLPDLDSFEFGKLQHISPPETTQADTDSAPGSIAQPEDDVWQLSLDVAAEVPKLRTWEAFASQAKAEPVQEEKREVYISEAGAQAFDAALDRWQKSTGGAGDVLQSAFFLKCLGLLGAGRSSALFQWDTDRAVFTQTLQNVRLSGLGLTTAQSVIEELGNTGGAFVELRTFVERTYAAKLALPSRIALARCVQVILEVLEQELAANVPDARTMLQVMSHFDVPGAVLQELRHIVRATKAARSNFEAIRAVQDKVHQSTEACSPYHSIHLEILHRVSQPWLQEVSRRIGLSRGEAGLEDADMNVAGLLSSEDEERILELSTGLDILIDACPDHPLLSPASWALEQPDLDHSSLHVDAGLILNKARNYEADLMQAIRQYHTGTGPVTSRTRDIIGDDLTEEAMAWADNDGQQQYFSDILSQFSQPPGRTLTFSGPLPSDLRSLVLAAVQSGEHTARFEETGVQANIELPHQNHTPLLTLQPYLHAQSRLINGTILRLLFRTYNIRQHLALHHSFSLFGSGIFTQRLTTALFSADASSAERRTGSVIGKSGGLLGLRLDSARSWPPGGSELRLALMGILSESYNSSASPLALHQQNNELPGGLSFSIRELEDADIERILDPNSIYALDFLRLSYDRPKPLDVLFTPHALERYDEIFRTLLRLIRMVHVTTALKRLVTSSSTHATAGNGIQAFATEAHHFITGLAGYIFDVGIGVPWAGLMLSLDKLENDLASEEADTGEGYGSRVKIGLRGLADLHEGVLDSIRTRLLLRQKQGRLREMVEGVFSLILGVWRRVQQEGEGGGSQSAVGIEELDSLRKGIGALLGLIADMGRKARGRRQVVGHGSGSRAAEEKADLEAMDMLTVRLDLTGFYSRRGVRGEHEYVDG